MIEDRAVPGGKARSIWVPGSGRDGRQDLPAEHGFRFFPGFDRQPPDTMSRIPFERQAHGVLDNLRDATQAEIARIRRTDPASYPGVVPAIDLRLHRDGPRDITGGQTVLTAGDTAYFVQRLLVLLTSCDARRYGEWERQSWWGFSGVAGRSACLSTLPCRRPDLITRRR